MKNCLDEGTLRAYLDGELAEAQVSRADAHLAQCADCRSRLERMETALRRVGELLNALAPEDLVAIRTSARGWRWAVGALASAVAAAIVLFLASSKPAGVARPVVARKDVSALTSQPVRQVAARKRARVRHRRAAEPQAEEFVALAGADPMQMGMVVRVMVPVSGLSLDGAVREIAADVVIGEDGRARAIRFVE
jgi:anti-sigma factor RsiW